MSGEGKSSEAPILCPLCQYPAEILNRSHPGYEQPATFVIAECSYCDAQFCHPMTADEKLYERVYEHAATLPGYSRYKWYTDQVGKQKDPLGWLAEQEEAYAFIAGKVGGAKGGRVLEVGSGFGYLTFALRRAGYDVRGLELSERAVSAARARFGDFYELCDITQVDGSKFLADVIVMTEVVEHTADPLKLLRCLNGMLRPGGVALVTTPNKSAVAKGAYWMTDNPPVHFWWFSETTLRRLAQMSGFTISFNGAESHARTSVWPAYFDDKGRQIFPANWLRRLLEVSPGFTLSLLSLARRSRQRRARREANDEHDGTMCVVLKKIG